MIENIKSKEKCMAFQCDIGGQISQVSMAYAGVTPSRKAVLAVREFPFYTWD